MISAIVRKPIDFVVTSLLWVYFTFGFLLLFAPYLAWFSIRNKSDEFDYQNVFHRFFRIFFKLVLLASPLLSIQIDPKLKTIRSGVIVSNHQSYLDPLLFISIFQKHKTIVKNSFFSVPVFSWLMRKSGYVPSAANGKQLALVVRYIGQMKEYLTAGGILFVFPEGTRSRNGALSGFHKGAFSIARQCQAPVHIVRIKNTNRLFKPGSILFNTCRHNKIELELLGTIESANSKEEQTAEQMAEMAKTMIADQLIRDKEIV